MRSKHKVILSLLSSTVAVSAASVVLTSCTNKEDYKVIGLDDDIKVVYHDTTIVDLALQDGNKLKDDVVWSAQYPIGNHSSVSFNGSQMIVNGKEIGTDKYKIYAKTTRQLKNEVQHFVK